MNKLGLAIALIGASAQAAVNPSTLTLSEVTDHSIAFTFERTDQDEYQITEKIIKNGRYTTWPTIQNVVCITSPCAVFVDNLTQSSWHTYAVRATGNGNITNSLQATTLVYQEPAGIFPASTRVVQALPAHGCETTYHYEIDLNVFPYGGTFTPYLDWDSCDRGLSQDAGTDANVTLYLRDSTILEAAYAQAVDTVAVRQCLGCGSEIINSFSQVAISTDYGVTWLETTWDDWGPVRYEAAPTSVCPIQQFCKTYQSRTANVSIEPSTQVWIRGVETMGMFPSIWSLRGVPAPVAAPVVNGPCGGCHE